MRRLKDENVYLHNKLVQIDNTQYANYFDSIHHKKHQVDVADNNGEGSGSSGNRNAHQEATLDLSSYATKAQVNELRDAVAAESMRIDKVLVHTALVQRADEDLQALKNKLQDYHLNLDSLSSSRAAMEGKSRTCIQKWIT